jgi:hypothetical protein
LIKKGAGRKMKTAIEFLLFRSDVSNYKIAKETGIGQNVLSNYFTGKADIGNMSLDNAEILYNHFKGLVEKMEKEFGTVTFEGKAYTLTQGAWLTHTQRLDGIADNHYLANAIDQEGNEYNVYWNPVEGWEQMEDESDCCDWDNPVSVKEI